MITAAFSQPGVEHPTMEVRAEVLPEVTSEGRRESPRKRPKRAGKGLKAAGFTMLGVGSLLSVTGGTGMALGLQRANTCMGECSGYGAVLFAFSSPFFATGQTLGGVGTGLVAWGYSKDTPQVIGVSPWVQPDGGGVVLSGKW